LNNLVLDKSVPIKLVLETLVRSGEGIVFLVEESRLIGSISDGDIRKSLLQGLDINSPAELFVNRNCRFVTQESSPIDVHYAFSQEGVKHVPVVDMNHKLLHILRPGDKFVIPVCEPNLGQTEKEFVNRALNSGWISSVGSYVSEFEEVFREFIGARHAVAVANGTLGLVLALKLVGVEHGDEVIVPNVTFGATANAVIQVGGTPIFADIEKNSTSIDIDSIRKKITEKTKAIIPVHLYGKPVNMPEVMKLASENNLKVIEDSAEAIGSKVNDIHVGNFGDVGVFSFFANKTITTGEGGMIVFNNPEFLELARKMRSHGFSSEKRYWHEVWGSNFRLTNLQAALGCAQMSRVGELVAAKRKIYETYRSIIFPALEEILSFSDDVPNEVNSHWLVIIRFKIEVDLEEVMRDLQINGIETRRMFTPLSLQPAFKSKIPNDDLFINCLAQYEKSLCLPSSTNLTFSEIERVGSALIKYFLKSK
jgi:perosamine synthetase